jgi:2-(1,2-epoxy-1,2-dihydrophenyl)acetyl-CoA isomerase
MELTTVILEKNEGIATITLNRPDSMNTYSPELLSELLVVFENVTLDENVRTVILTGAGRAFSAGADIKSAEQLIAMQNEHPEKEDILKLLNRVIIAIRKTPKPVIAALNGVAAGGGANLALACDLIVASEKAKFAENFINIGLVSDGGGTYLVESRVGYHRAAEIFFAGKILTAEDAHGLGLFNRVVPPDEVASEARAMAQTLSQKAPCALAAGKALLNRESLPRLMACLEDETQTQRRMMATEDAKEGMTAFLEKRKPNFIGR